MCPHRGDDLHTDDTPLEDLPTDVRVARTQRRQASGGHVWFNARGLPTCALCGVIRSRQGNRTCRGVLPAITLRGTARPAE